MTYWKVEQKCCFDRSSHIVKTWYFKSEKEANEFKEKGNKILEEAKAYDHGIYGPEKIEVNISEVDVELNKLKKDYENYVY